jgi:hypothetical protein
MKARLALAGAALLALTGTAGAATAPAAGTYNIVTLGLAQTGTGCSSGSVGVLGLGTVFYPGPARTGAVVYQVKNSSTKFGFSVVTFPKTPAAGVRGWSGTYMQLEQPSGKTKSGTFTGTFTFIDARHFLLLLKPTEGGCTETIQITAYMG